MINLVYETLSRIDFQHLWNAFIVPIGMPAAIIIIALLFGIWVNRRIKNFVATNVSISEDDHIKSIILKSMQGLPIILSLMFGLYVLIDILPLPDKINHILYCILLTVVVFAIARLISRSINALIEIKTSSLGYATSSTTLLSSSINAAIYIIFGLTLLSHYGISITPLITALGIGSMAIAFGLQETIANLFSGLHLLISKQVRIGDYIKLASGEEGKISDISWRFTTVISSAGNAIIIPNQKIASSILTNYNMPVQELAVIVPIGVSYDSDLEHVELVTLEVARQVTERVDGEVTAEPSVRFHTLDESSINFNVVLHTSQFANQLLLKHAFIKAIIARYRAEGIEIPYPIRTLIQAQNNDKNLST